MTKSNKEPNLYSFSKLETYNRCSEMFKLQYIDKVPMTDSASLETEVGSRCHAALEEVLLNPDSGLLAYDVLVNQWKDTLEAEGLGALYTDLNHIASDFSTLMARASWAYNGADAIRTSNGSVARSPELTTTWKTAAKVLKLDERKAKVDRLAAEVSKRWRTISLADTFATSCSIMHGYKLPQKEIHEIAFVELALSDVKYAAANPTDPSKKLDGEVTTRSRGKYPAWIDPVTKKPQIVRIDRKVNFPSLDEKGELKKDKTKQVKYPDTNDMFNGYIDLVCYTSDNKLMIVDHKTSKGEPPTADKVARHHQLLLYGWAVWRSTGHIPDYIAINHLRSGRLVKAPFSMDKALEVLKTKLQTIKGIDHSVYIKQDPYAYGSMCITDSAKGPRYCPFFAMCHPDLAVVEDLSF